MSTCSGCKFFEPSQAPESPHGECFAFPPTVAVIRCDGPSGNTWEEPTSQRPSVKTTDRACRVFVEKQP